MTMVGPQPVAMRIDAGGADDLDDVMEIMRAAFDADFGEAWTRSQCAGILPLSGVMLALAHDEQGRICGFALQRAVAGESELLLLAVRPKAQRRGIGGALLEDFVERGRSSGASRLHLEVRDGNPAVAMYQALGFHVEGRRPKYYRGGDGCLRDALTMVLTI